MMERFKQNEFDFIGGIVSTNFVIMSMVNPEFSDKFFALLEGQPTLLALARSQIDKDLEELDIPRSELEVIVPHLVRCKIASSSGSIALDGETPYRSVQEFINAVRSAGYPTREEKKAIADAALQINKALWPGPSPEAIANPIPVGTEIMVKEPIAFSNNADEGMIFGWSLAVTITPCPAVEFSEWGGDFVAESFTGSTRAFCINERGVEWDFTTASKKKLGIDD